MAEWQPGDRAAPYGARTCGTCRPCREGRDNLCENVQGVMGFHIDGFCRDLVVMPARLLVRVPNGLPWEEAACGTVTFSTVQHMLFDNAKLEPGETILVHAAGSGIGTVAIAWRRRLAAPSLPPPAPMRNAPRRWRLVPTMR